MATSILTTDAVEALIKDAPTQKLRTLRNHFVDEIIKIRDVPNHAIAATLFYQSVVFYNEPDWGTEEGLFNYQLGPVMNPDKYLYKWRSLEHLGHVLNSVVIGATASTQLEYGSYINDLLDAVEGVLITIGAVEPEPPEVN